MQRLSESERVELWDRWEAGESQRSIARALGRSPSTVRTVVVSSQWRRPVPPREWSELRLSLAEREEILRGSLKACLYGGLLMGWVGLLRPCAVKLLPMVAVAGIGRWLRTGRLGSGRSARNR